jgi:AAA+ ATPase superfamily predicted ATPase
MLPFLDREEELKRLERALGGAASALVCLYGRRWCGKTRLIQQGLRGREAVYYVGDDREEALQRGELAREIGRLLPGFDSVEYPDWASILDRWDREAPARAVLVLDEFPFMVGATPALPSVLQKFVDRRRTKARHLVLAGSSQRMMAGYLLDASAPLYGRARELMKIEPLAPRWIGPALGLRTAREAVTHYAVWGGVPRYWELAVERGGLDRAVIDLVLSPLGVLYREPARLLLDDLRDTRQAASILSLIGRGCHRVSEIAARLQRPATSLSRPLGVLMEMGLVRREIPFGRSVRDTKKTLYRIDDPFVRFWYTFVEPNRALLEAGRPASVWRDAQERFRHHLAGVWEDLVRASLPRVEIGGRRFGPAGRWWGSGTDRKPLELDVVAASGEDRLLVGEVKLSCTAAEARAVLTGLQERAARLPAAKSKRVECVLWVLEQRRPLGMEWVYGPDAVLF